MWHGVSTAFFPVLNDFWGNAFAATLWSWSARQQWNGFFPPGYPTILTLLPGARLVESAYYFNVFSGAASLLAVWWFVQRRTSPWTALIAGMTVAGHPLVLTQVLTTGPDAFFVALAVSGAFVVFTTATRAEEGWSWPIAGGLLLGAACWIRFHGLTWAPAVIAAAGVVVGRSSLRPLVRAGIVFAACAALLGLLGVAAGDIGAMTRDQAFNVYSRLVHPVNWFHLDREPIPQTLAAAIARDPSAFLRNYLTFSAPHLWLGLATVVAALVGRGEARRFSLFTLVTGLVFVPVVNLGASPRGIASFVPLVMVAVVWAAADAVARLERASTRRGATLVLGAAAAMFAWQYWLPEHRRYVEEVRIRVARASEVEDILRRDRVKLGTQVFAVADFYFVHAPGWHVGNYFPRIKGGWPTLDLPGFLETYPPPSTETLDAFLDDCQRFGISHLVLSEPSGAMFRDLGQLYDGRLTTGRVAEVGSIPGMRVFRIVG